MKRIIRTFIILISLTACESKKSNSIEENVVESEKKISDFKTRTTKLTEIEKEEKLRKEINAQYLA